MSNLLDDFKIGMVLAGGGAKGAYEAGVFKTLWELELVDNIKVISGTSIGSVNAMLFDMDDRKVIKDSWGSLSYSRFINLQEKSKNLTVSQLIGKVKNIHSRNDFFEQIRSTDISFLSQKGIDDFLEEYVDFKKIKESRRDIFACAYNIDKGEPEYFKLNEYSEEEIKSMVLASCAIPFMFSPINISGSRYADGGICSPEYKYNNIDNVPIYPLKDYDCDLIIVVHLHPNQKIDKSEFKGKKIIEIRPSVSLELINGTGGVMLNPNTLRQNKELGYRDSMTILAPIIVKLLKGESI